MKCFCVLMRAWLWVSSALFGLVLVSNVATAAAPRPNVVMVVADDQAWSDYGFIGHPQIQTPRIDTLAAQSLAFRRGYVASSLCCPSLASIITGLYPHQHKVTSNDPPKVQTVGDEKAAAKFQAAQFQAGREVMNRHLEAVPTLPRALQEFGYVSFQSGKWWQGNFSRGGFTHGMTRGERHGDDGLEIGRATMKPLFDFMDEAKRDGKPFFAWYAPLLPHQPHTPPERLLAKYLASAPSEYVAKYWAMIEWFDETVGQLLDHLEEQQLAENTIVIYLADNGWIQSLDNPRYAPKSKQSQYDGGLRTPILIRWPGHVTPRISDDLAISIDLAPTILTAMGSKPTPAMQGINLLDAEATHNRQAIFGECFTHNANDLNNPAANLRWRWVVAGKWKLIVPDAKNEPGLGVELYDVTIDPSEENNLAAQHPDRVAQLSTLLDGWWKP